MAYVINDSCVSCGTCEGECPVGAIAPGDGKYEINPDSCVDCGTCAGACPVGAIAAEYAKKEEDAFCALFFCFLFLSIF